MILAARHRSYSRLESSPVASGWSRSCSMMKRSIVTTDVSDSTQCVHLEGDVARLIGAPDTDAAALEPRHHFGGGMPVVVARAHADHRVSRLQLGGDAAQVIGVAGRRDDERETGGAVPPQVRDHHALAGVPHWCPRAAVDQNPTPRGRPQQGRITLPDIEEMYLNATAIVERRGAGNRSPGDQGREKCGPCGQRPAPPPDPP